MRALYWTLTVTGWPTAESTRGIRDTGIRDNRAFNLYGYKLALNGAKTVKSITLPNTRNVTVLAITLSPAVAAAPDFTLSATPPALSVVQGGSGTSQIAVSAQKGFAASVTFTVSGLPEQQHLLHPTLEDSGAALNPAISLNFLFPCPIRFG